MKKRLISVTVAAALAISACLIRQMAHAQDVNPQPVEKAGSTIAGVAGTEESLPVVLTDIPSGYRDWKLVSVAREAGELDDIRAILGNDIAMEAYRKGVLPFPDGAIIARLAWSFFPSEENNKAFGREQSFVAGPPKNGVQFMIKDSKKYSSTGGWGYAQFDDGQPALRVSQVSCFACHQAVTDRDFVFTRYSP